jgi:hypothetical protein
VDDEESIGSDYRVEIDPTREIAPRRDRDSARRMRGTLSNSAEASELRGDTTDERRSRRPKRSSGNTSGSSDSVIDIDESDIRPVSPKRRPRPSDDSGNNPNSDRPRNRNSDTDNYGELPRDNAASGRRRRPTSRPSAYSSNEAPDTDDF